MEAVRRLTSHFRAAVPLLLLATGGVETQTPSASSDSGSSDIPVIRKKNYSRFSSVAAAESAPSSQEPSQVFFSMCRPDIVKAGDPVLHERACEVDHSDIKSQRVQKITDYMIQIMRSNAPVYTLSPNAPEYCLSAPQIGIPSTSRVRLLINYYQKVMISWSPKSNSLINGWMIVSFL